MSIVPLSHLSAQERLILGNNIAPRPSRRYRSRKRDRAALLAAVNRSLQSVGERVDTLHKPLLAAS